MDFLKSTFAVTRVKISKLIYTSKLFLPTDFDPDIGSRVKREPRIRAGSTSVILDSDESFPYSDFLISAVT